MFDMEVGQSCLVVGVVPMIVVAFQKTCRLTVFEKVGNLSGKAKGIGA